MNNKRIRELMWGAQDAKAGKYLVDDGHTQDYEDGYLTTKEAERVVARLRAGK